ncbi:hypothetical protein SODALDRAFT_327836 [Sodiomyces alkalinus F11]|uniref:Secreted protein n=1 Tax=Sodiomyces alkalinus (strain CBS 110278 / VKM F-3762 / F11) TaxID=1314773 RepID=A0A3N2QA71_SODAK|nr:hypothetical protein SODALDRAFT_327836 [Sodiomyces alkalinus F11]ROT43626.1 hypothetical protein SODALDRAFT_327836 [Sodiomyces alkalinus F11]
MHAHQKLTASPCVATLWLRSFVLISCFQPFAGHDNSQDLDTQKASPLSICMKRRVAFNAFVGLRVRSAGSFDAACGGPV